MNRMANTEHLPVPNAIGSGIDGVEDIHSIF